MPHHVDIVVEHLDAERAYDRHATHIYSLARQFGNAKAAGHLTVRAFSGVFASPDALPVDAPCVPARLAAEVHRRGVASLRADTGSRKLEGAMSSAELETVLRGRAGSAAETALSEIPRAQRTAIIFAYYGGYTAAEIAARLHRSKRTVKIQLGMGLAGLQCTLERTDDELPSVA